MSKLSDQAGIKNGWIIRILPIAAGAYALLGGSVSLLGWIIGVDRLTDWGGDGISIKANTSICLIVAGIGLLAWSVRPPGGRLVVRTAGFLTAIIGGLTLSEHVLGVDYGIDTLLFLEAEGASATASPGRMGPPASASFVIIGSALFLLTIDRLQRWASFLAAAALAISALSLVGFLFGANQLYSIPRFTGIALQTATMIAALGLGLAAAVPTHGIAGVFVRNDAGGVVFRRLFLPLIIISVTMGWLRVAGQEAGLYDTAFGSATRTLVEIALLVGLLWWTANDISRSDTKIREGADALAERDRKMSSVLESLSDIFIVFDADLRIAYLNSAAQRLFSEYGLEEADIRGKNVFEVFPESRDTVLGRELERSRSEAVQIDVEDFYGPFNRWFHARYFPTDDGGVSLFALDVTERRIAEERVTRSARELAVLFSYSDRLNRADSSGEVYEAALDTIMNALDCQKASILLFDENGVMSFVAARGLTNDYMAAVNGHSPWKKGERNAKPIGIVSIDDADLDPELKAVIVGEGISALAFIPLISNDTLIGKFMVYYDKPHHFTEAEYEIALTVGYQIAFGVERKRTEEALRENEERLRLATQTGKVGVWDWDISTNHVSWTPTVYTMHGVQPGEFDGTVDAFQALVHPDDRKLVGEKIDRALKGDQPYEVEFRVPKSDGGTNWLFTNALVIRDVDGRPVRMIGATVDITESKLAARELARVAAIVNSSRDAIVGKDLNGIVTSWNRGAELMFGYTSEEMIGRSITTLIPDERQEEEEGILQRLRRGEYIDHYETVRQRKDGTLLDISLTVSPVVDSNGQIVGASKIARDITERRRTEAAIRDREIMGRLVEAQEAERHRIARDLHDHLGQQLTALRLKLESVRSKCNGDASLAGDMDDIQTFASRIDMDINYLAWELRPTELDQLGLENALRSFVREWSKTYGIEAEFHASKSGIPRLKPDLETNLYRIVQEGLNNILKHANASSVSVLLENRRGQVVLIIEDDGIGFDPLSDHNGKPGKGLGLVGMRERTALLGGTIELESRQGRGTTIFVRVPNNSSIDQTASLPTIS